MTRSSRNFRHLSTHRPTDKRKHRRNLLCFPGFWFSIILHFAFYTWRHTHTHAHSTFKEDGRALRHTHARNLQFLFTSERWILTREYCKIPRWKFALIIQEKTALSESCGVRETRGLSNDGFNISL